MNNDAGAEMRKISALVLLGLQLGFTNMGGMHAALAAEVDLRSELATFEEKTESEKLRTAREPKALIQNLQRKLGMISVLVSAVRNNMLSNSLD